MNGRVNNYAIKINSSEFLERVFDFYLFLLRLRPHITCQLHSSNVKFGLLVWCLCDSYTKHNFFNCWIKSLKSCQVTFYFDERLRRLIINLQFLHKLDTSQDHKILIKMEVSIVTSYNEWNSLLLFVTALYRSKIFRLFVFSPGVEPSTDLSVKLTVITCSYLRLFCSIYFGKVL